MSTLIRLEHLSAEVRLPDGERLTTVDDVSASFERGTSTAIIEGTWLTGADEPATLETAVNESARQYVHDGTVALARTGNPQQVPAWVNGVIADGTDAPTIYVNATTLQRYWPQAWDPNRLSCSGHQSHTAATHAGVAMNQKPFWTSPPTAGWSAFRSSIASGKQSACGMCTMVEMPQPQNVDY